jgi:hypothetical protein
MTETANLELRKIRIIGVPVHLWAKSQEHVQDLLREFAFIQASPSDAHPVPGRLIDVIDTVTAGYSGFSGKQTAQLAEAAGAGVESLDLEYEVPVEVGPVAKLLGDVLDEADEFCRQGKHLLTLATPPDCLAYRQWYLGEFINQLNGDEPVSWPEWSKNH